MSHHSQSQSDPNYLLRLQNIRIDDSNRTRSMNIPSEPSDLIETITRDGQQHINSRKYVPFDRNNIISASKFNNSRATDAFALVKQNAPLGTVYLGNNSPTHSLSGSSHHSESPRASLIGSMVNHDPRTAPLIYENIEYCTYTAPPLDNTYYGSFESTNRKAQPQVPTNGLQQSSGRYAHTPQPDLDPTPIYENLQSITGQRAQPQVSASRKAIHYSNDTIGGYVQPNIQTESPYRVMAPAIPVKRNNGSTIHSQSFNNTPKVQPVTARASLQQSPRHNQIQVKPNIPDVKQNPAPYDYHLPPKYSSYLPTYEQKPQLMIPTNVSMNPNYIDDIGSDYVCMTANQKQPALLYAQKAVTTNIATSSSVGSPKHISSTTPTELSQQRQLQEIVLPPVSPTPSQISSESGSGKRKIIVPQAPHRNVLNIFLCKFQIKC